MHVVQKKHVLITTEIRTLRVNVIADIDIILSLNLLTVIKMIETYLVHFLLLFFSVLFMLCQ